MANDVISEVINKGVPIQTPITIRHSDLYNLCDDKDKLNQVITREFAKYLKYLGSLFPMEEISLFHTMNVSTDPETLEKRLQFSRDGFYASLIYNLNYGNVCNNAQNEITMENFDINVLYERTKKLRKIKDEFKLQYYFPALYVRYKEMEEFYKKVNQLYNMVSKSNLSEKEKEQRLLETIRELKVNGYGVPESVFKKAQKFSLKRFCSDFADCFDNMISHVDEIYEYLDNNTFSISDINLDKEKLELYIAYRFLIELKSERNEDKQKFVYFLANYFKENQERKNSLIPQINVGGISSEHNGLLKKKLDGVDITPKDIYLEFRKVLIDNPDIKLINFSDVDFKGMSLEEVEVFINEYLETFKANWDIIPKEEMGGRVKPVVPSKPRTIDEERLNQIFMDKVEFYSELDPFMCIQGRETFDGYIGYIFTNGKVILDKFYYKSNSGKVSKGDAIYCMNIEDFYRLSMYPKSVLRKDPNVICIEHRNGWQDKTLNIIKQSGNGFKTKDEISKLEQKQLIKRQSK